MSVTYLRLARACYRVLLLVLGIGICVVIFINRQKRGDGCRGFTEANTDSGTPSLIHRWFALAHSALMAGVENALGANSTLLGGEYCVLTRAHSVDGGRGQAGARAERQPARTACQAPHHPSPMPRDCKTLISDQPSAQSTAGSGFCAVDSEKHNVGPFDVFGWRILRFYKRRGRNAGSSLDQITGHHWSLVADW